MLSLRRLLIPLLIIGSAAVYAQTTLPDISAILVRNKGALGLSSEDLSGYTVSDAYTTAHLGVTHVYLQQTYQGIPLYNGILNLNLIGDKLVSFGNRWITDLRAKAPSHSPEIAAQSAVERAASELGKNFPQAVEIRKEQNSLGQDTKVVFEPGNLSQSAITAELVWLKEAHRESVLLCWNVEIAETDTENVWRIFIDAHSGAFVRKDNLVLHCTFDGAVSPLRSVRRAGNTLLMRSPLPLSQDSSYNVFAMPIESPNHGDRSIVVTPWHSAGMDNAAVTLGWHDDGSTAYTITRGNNVYAYEDINHDNNPGYSPDTSNLRFDYPFDPQLDPVDNLGACVTNLFYWNNLMHDVTYQYGFDEVSGNFQNDNLDRGGNGSDYVLAEAQDGGGLNNANFYTPSDGSKGRMQMYLWSPVSETSPLTVNSPESLAGPINAVESAFSNNNLLVDIGLTMGDLVLVQDADSMTHEACGTISNGDSLVGRIAVIDRGNCDFVVKVKAVQNLGAIAAIVINNVSGSPFAMGGTDNTIVIPAVMISLNDGNLLKAVMDTAVVNVSLDSVPTITPDGDYDSGVICHEYCHGVSNRLTGGPSMVSCLNNEEQMGEGWSDYLGLMMTTDWTTATATDLRGIGTYVIGELPGDTGIRTYPYTTDTTDNPFTYADIADAPVSGGSPDPHFIGSVWCTMLWDMTWSIIEIAGADPDMYHGTGGNNIALQLVIDGLKLQPCSPGFVDGRDAILLADQLDYGGQYDCAIWKAFARRGLGIGADEGSSNDYQDGIESFAMPNGVFIDSKPDTTLAGEGQEVTFNLKTTCGCEGKSNLQISDVLSDDLIYIPGSGGTLDGNIVEFSADTLSPHDSLDFSYRAYVSPCSASESMLLSTDDAEGPDQYHSIKLAGSGTRRWVKSTSLSVSPTHSWYAEDYSHLGDFALTLIDPIAVSGPVEIAFYHRYQTEPHFDGGVIEYSLNGGTTWQDTGPYFIENGYPSAISSNSDSTNSPLLGRAAFTGNSDAQFDTTGFIHSAIRLPLAGSQSLLLRFRFASDGGVAGPGIDGWYVDDITINQLSAVTNQTRVTANDTLVDSLYYSLSTRKFVGSVVYVDSGATGVRDGTSWANAMLNLPLAMEVAGCYPGDSVFVAEGTYLPNQEGDRTRSFHIPDSTSVFGGFPSGGSSFTARDPSTYHTVFSGDLGAQNDNTDNAFHVLEIDSAQQDILLDGVTISHGNANGTDDHSRGASVFCRGGLTLQNITISDNHGLSDGQLIFIRDAIAHLRMKDCTIHAPNDSPAKLFNTDSGQVTIQGNTVFILE